MYRISPLALRDVVAILDRSEREFGAAAARRLHDRLTARFEAIAAGHALGHRRADIPSKRRFLVENEHPFVVVFDAKTREIVRVVHGARDVPRALRRRRT